MKFLISAIAVAVAAGSSNNYANEVEFQAANEFPASAERQTTVWRKANKSAKSSKTLKADKAPEYDTNDAKAAKVYSKAKATKMFKSSKAVASKAAKAESPMASAVVDGLGEVSLGEATGGRLRRGCTLKSIEADYLLERYAINMTLPSHRRALAAAVNGGLAIGSTTQLIPEANDASRVDALVVDGISGDTDFPHGDMKALFTVGEINMCDNEFHGDVYVGVPDGMGSYLIDDNTVRIIVQSESYGPITRWESWPYPTNKASGNLATFTGSHVQYADFDRAGLSNFMEYDGPASDIITGFGQVAHTYYNLAGDLIAPRNGEDPTPSGAHFSNTDENGVWALEKYPSAADWLMQSLCSSHLEEAHQFGPGMGVEDDMYITNEEWITYAPGAEFVGISMHAIDLANKVDYAVGSVTNSGWEKIVEMNPMHTDYVILSLSGYNGAYNNPEGEINGRNLEYTKPDGTNYTNPQNVCPARIYVGMKGKMEDGSDAPADDFLARNGLRYGKVYGFAIDMSEDGPTGGLFRDAFHKDRANGAKVEGKFVPIDWQWDGKVRNFRHDGAWEFQLPVPGFDELTWWNSGNLTHPGSKTEHNSPDTREGMTAFVQGSTAGYFGHQYVHGVKEALDAALASGEDFPASFDSDYYVYQGENDIRSQIVLGGAGLYAQDDANNCTDVNDATQNCDKPDSIKNTFEDIDGLEVLAAEEGLFVIIQEDSGNDLGERMFISSVLEHEDDGEELTYYFMGMSGGPKNTRMMASVGIPETASDASGSHEFSGIIDVSGMLMKDAGGSFAIPAGDGHAKRRAELQVPLEEKLVVLGLQAHNYHSGVVEAFEADRGGQMLLYQPEIFGQ